MPYDQELTSAQWMPMAGESPETEPSPEPKRRVRSTFSTLMYCVVSPAILIGVLAVGGFWCYGTVGAAKEAMGKKETRSLLNPIRLMMWLAGDSNRDKAGAGRSTDLFSANAYDFQSELERQHRNMQWQFQPAPGLTNLQQDAFTNPPGRR